MNRTNVTQPNSNRSLIEETNDIPEITDDAFVFDRIKLNQTVRETASKKIIPLSNKTDNSELDKAGSKFGFDSSKRPEGRPLTKEEAAIQQRRIRSFLKEADEIDTRCNQYLSDLKSHLKDFDLQIDISKNPIVKKAVKKIFKKGLTYINKDMYLAAVERFNEIQKSKLDKELES